MPAIHGVLVFLCSTLLQPETRFVQVHPKRDDAAHIERSEDQRRAVVILHGLALHPFSSEKPKQAYLHDWQQAESTLVRTLGTDSDVFAFAYSQNLPISEIAESDGLRDGIKRLRELDYTAIVLVGHSAGGLIARQFVEDHPDAGVAKVIQICSPNNGSTMARPDRVVRKTQESFLKSLSKSARDEFLKTRKDKKIPATVDFVCVVGDGGGAGDFVVSDDSQWPDDLRLQGIPAVHVNTTHPTSVRSPRVAELVAGLVRERQPRWDEEKVVEMKKAILGK
jgi:hypothetical protein